MFARPSEWTRTAQGNAASAAPLRGRLPRTISHSSATAIATRRWPSGSIDALERFRVPVRLVGRVTDHGAVPQAADARSSATCNELPASGDLGDEIRDGARGVAIPHRAVLAGGRADPGGPMPRSRHSSGVRPGRLRLCRDRRWRAVRQRNCRVARRRNACRRPCATNMTGVDGRRATRLSRSPPICAVLGKSPARLPEARRRNARGRARRACSARHDPAATAPRSVAGGSLVGMVVASGLAVTAIQARDAARDQRREAEGLVGFMLGDLRTKLEPIGRLDVLDWRRRPSARLL